MAGEGFALESPTAAAVGARLDAAIGTIRSVLDAGESS
jgi:hypothetical protein